MSDVMIREPKLQPLRDARPAEPPDEIPPPPDTCRWCDQIVSESEPWPGYCNHCDEPHDRKGCAGCDAMEKRLDQRNDFRPS